MFDLHMFHGNTQCKTKMFILIFVGISKVLNSQNTFIFKFISLCIKPPNLGQLYSESSLQENYSKNQHFRLCVSNFLPKKTYFAALDFQYVERYVSRVLNLQKSFLYIFSQEYVIQPGLLMPVYIGPRQWARGRTLGQRTNITTPVKDPELI